MKRTTFTMRTRARCVPSRLVFFAGSHTHTHTRTHAHTHASTHAQVMAAAREESVEVKNGLEVRKGDKIKLTDDSVVTVTKLEPADVSWSKVKTIHYKNAIGNKHTHTPRAVALPLVTKTPTTNKHAGAHTHRRHPHIHTSHGLTGCCMVLARRKTDC